MNSIRDRLVEVFEFNGYYIPISTNSDDINITEFDITSLEFISIMISIEEEFDISIPENKLSIELFESFNGLVEFITCLLENKLTQI